MRLHAASFFALALAVVGCKKDRSDAAPPAAVASSSSALSDDPDRLCGQKSICPKEPVDDESTKLCATLARDPVCGTKFLALVKCQIAKERCDSSGNVDQAATMDLCKIEETALQACEQAKAAAGQSSAK